MNRPFPAPPPGAIPQFVSGVGDIWRALGLLLQRPSLWPWAAIPFVFNVLLFAGLYFAVGQYAMPWITGRFFPEESGFWWEALGVLVKVLIWLTLVLLTIFLFVPIASIVAAPFNDLLSEKVERMVRPHAPLPSQPLMRSLVVSFKTTLFLTLRSLLLLVCVLPLYLVPGIGSMLAAVAQAAITILYLSLEYTSYSMDRRAYDHRRRSAFLQRNRPRTLGMGAMAFVIMLVPLANALFIPVSAIAGTLLFCETEPESEA